MAGDEKGATAVYVAWATFLSALDTLAQGTPNRIDRTVFPGMAWGVQSQLFAGLRFLGLIDDNSHPTGLLHEVAVTDETRRKEALAGILRERYAEIIALDLTKATLAQVRERMSTGYNAKGSTLDRAVRFFLAAVDYVGIEVSSFIKPRNTNGAPTTRRRRTTRKPQPVAAITDPPAVPPPQPAPGASTRAVTLRSGGTVTVAVSVDLFALAPDDRKFVFSLIDMLEEYRRSSNEEGSAA